MVLVSLSYGKRETFMKQHIHMQEFNQATIACVQSISCIACQADEVILGVKWTFVQQRNGYFADIYCILVNP